MKAFVPWTSSFVSSYEASAVDSELEMKYTQHEYLSFTNISRIMTNLHPNMRNSSLDYTWGASEASALMMGPFEHLNVMLPP